jgi:hypothetical protein
MPQICSKYLYFMLASGSTYTLFGELGRVQSSNRQLLLRERAVDLGFDDGLGLGQGGV